MARLNVWVPDELAERARASGLNVSALTQAALHAELDRHATDSWLDRLELPVRDDPSGRGPRTDHATMLAALDEGRDEFEPTARPDGADRRLDPPGSDGPAPMSVPEQRGPEPLVLDAAVAVDLLAGTEVAETARGRLRGSQLHVPAHFSAEVLSALGRLHRHTVLDDDDVTGALERLAAMPVTEHPVPGLLAGAWQRRGRLRLLDALYVELATRLDAVVVTTDLRLARAGTDRVEAITPAGS